MALCTALEHNKFPSSCLHMQEPIAQVTECFNQMQWHEKPVTVFDAATSDAEADLLKHLENISPTFDYQKNANKKDLKQHPDIVEYLKKHTVSGAYVWQWFAEPAALRLHVVPLGESVVADEVEVLLPDSPSMLPGSPSPPPGSSSILPLPAPVPVSALPQHIAQSDGRQDPGKLYATYSPLQAYAPDYSHVPTSKIRFGKTDTNAGKHSLALKHVRGTVRCGECHKFRAFYSKLAWIKLKLGKEPASEAEQHKAAEHAIERACEDSDWVCGAQLFPPSHVFHQIVYTALEMHCTSPMEAVLYRLSASIQKHAQFDVSLCGSCGVVPVDTHEQEEQTDEEDINERTELLLPMCGGCAEAGAEPVVKKVQTQKEATAAVKKRKQAKGRAKGKGKAKGKGSGRNLSRDEETEAEWSDEGCEKGQVTDTEISTDDDDDDDAPFVTYASPSSKRPKVTRAAAARDKP